MTALGVLEASETGLSDNPEGYRMLGDLTFRPAKWTGRSKNCSFLPRSPPGLPDPNKYVHLLIAPIAWTKRQSSTTDPDRETEMPPTR